MWTLAGAVSEGNDAFVLEGTTSGAQGGKYSFEVTGLGSRADRRAGRIANRRGREPRRGATVTLALRQDRGCGASAAFEIAQDARGPRAYLGERNVHPKEIAMRDTESPGSTRREPAGAR